VTHARRTSAGVLAVFGAIALVACGSERGSGPTAPETVTPTAPAIVTSEQVGPRGGVVTTTPITVMALVSGTACPALSFTVGTYVFKVSSTTQYTGGTCADIQPGSKINFSASRDSETSTVFTVAQVSFATSTTPTTTPVTTEGTITAIGSGICPELQFFFGSYAINVSSATQYSGGACADLKAGARVAIVGSKKATESFVRVTSLTFKRESTVSQATPVSAEVTVSSIVPATACPTLAFMVGPYTVTVSTATTFEAGTCARIAPNARLRLTGTRQGDGPIAASKIEFLETTSAPAAEGEGVVTTVVSATTCPALSFYIGPYLITVGSSTRFDGGVCDDVRAGTTVYVRGSLTADRAVAASSITIKSRPQEPQQTGEGDGRVSMLVAGTACPALSFTFEGYVVTTDASTRFNGRGCSAIAAGVGLHIAGRLTGDKRALATEITFKD
jgi:uncharacterized protein DUF5666